MNKTVFIVITRSFLIRNILRSGVLGYLKQDGCKVVIFLQTLKGSDIPDYLQKEFADENVIFEKVDDYLTNSFFDRLYRFFAKWTCLLVYTDSTSSYTQYKDIRDNRRVWFWKYIEKFVFSILGSMDWLKRLIRILEKKVFVSKFYSGYFDKYQPSIVFSTSIISNIDIAFMKEASRRGIKTVGMTKGWDHAARAFYRFTPDKVIVQNTVLKDYLSLYQRINKDKVEACGFPQFDWYMHKDLLVSREDFFSSLGLDPQRKLIFFGSEGPWSPQDDLVVDILLEFINTTNLLSADASLLIRPHYVDLKTKRYDRFQGLKNVKIDSSIVYHEFLSLNWDPCIGEIKHFVNLLYHMDVLINIASTLSLDACCFDKPIIALDFGVLHNLTSGKDMTNILYEADHYQDVLKTGAVDLVKSKEELLESLNNYFLHPEHKRGERKILLDKLCYKVDGNSARRVAYEILSML